MLNKILQVSILYDTYGRLLTGKQRLWFELHYLEDMSLAEIADEYNVTRQAVHDAILRAEQKLVNFEKQLCFLARMADGYEKLTSAINYLTSVNVSDDKSRVELGNARLLLQEVLDRLEV